MADRNIRDIYMNKASQKDEVADMIAMIDDMMDQGISRLKVKVTEELDEGTRRREYHHGRCDIGSPWAKGTPFDVLE